MDKTKTELFIEEKIKEFCEEISKEDLSYLDEELRKLKSKWFKTSLTHINIHLLERYIELKSKHLKDINALRNRFKEEVWKFKDTFVEEITNNS